MEPRIKILPEDLINKIAAGEVVERPASVVKELIENSIDAGAGRIKVEIQGGGQKLIRISDNGCGMSKEELSLSILRHSTSKIKSPDDLFNIQSLGFRGEALPSIASVSKFEINSKRLKDPSGTALILEGGKVIKTEEAGIPAGTTIVVKDLFFNTPVRKKFLKSPATEMGHIGDIVSKYALAFPKISFELISDGKPLLFTSGSGSLKDVVVSVYGVDLLRSLVEGEVNFKGGKISGLIGLPNISKIDKSLEVFFVNHRYIKNFLLNRALEDAYRALIPSNRHPVAILFIEIEPGLVDVNVHPSKREVKFSKTQEVMDAVRDFVKQVLLNFGEVRSMDKGINAGMEIGSGSWKEDSNFQPHLSSIQTGILTQIPTSSFQNFDLEVTTDQPLIPLYQLKNTYIICSDGDELILIDQHAAHERILYDQISHSFASHSQQKLLIPENIELSIKEIAALQDNLSYLNELGFDLEEFGHNTYILRAIPSISLKTSAKQLLLDILAEIQNLGNSVQIETKKENISKLIACKSAIKAGDKLSADEINRLIRDLYQTQNPLTCPHGRPTIIKISEAELIKRFARS